MAFLRKTVRIERKPKSQSNLKDQFEMEPRKIVKTAYGYLKMPEWHDDLIVRALELYGEWAYVEQQLLSSMIRPTDTIWDVGAFLGTFGLGISQLSMQSPAKIIAFEPNPALFDCLHANLHENAPCPFEVVPFAVAQSSRLIRPSKDFAVSNAGAIAYEDAESGDSNVLAAKSLYDLRQDYGNYDILKLDVEGMEDEAIRGDYDFIMSSRPVVWAECNESLSSIRLLEALVSLKYEPLYVAFPAFRRHNFNDSKVRMFPMAYEAVLLAAPADRISEFKWMVEGEDVIVRPVTTSFDLRRALWYTPRWALDEWAGLSSAELVALIGRQMRNEELVTFLNDRL